MTTDRSTRLRQRPHRSISSAHRRIAPGATHALTAVLLLASAAFAVFTASPAQAQITGHVLNEEGDPVPGAAVEAWAADRKIGGRLVDEDGWFLFPPP